MQAPWQAEHAYPCLATVVTWPRSNIDARRLAYMTSAPPNPNAEHVLYWMTSARRPHFNFALQRAVELATCWKKPLWVLEAIRLDYPWASERLHGFVVQGMADHARHFEARGIAYYPYVESHRGEGAGLVEALAARACAVVCDDYPCFFLPQMLKAFCARTTSAVVAVDANGLLPMRAAPRAFPTAKGFRSHMHKTLAGEGVLLPKPDPLNGHRLPPLSKLPAGVLQRWPLTPSKRLEATGKLLLDLPLDRSVAITEQRGGFIAARARSTEFVETQLERYATDRNHPDLDCTSALSSYLHFGHISAHEIWTGLTVREAWTPERITLKAKGQREGFWGMSLAGEAFADQLLTWREIGFNQCFHVRNYDAYASLPAWSRATLEKHASDVREDIYSLDQLATAQTNDPVWNAAQRQLTREGRMHNYLRMLWGKRILEWTRSPEEALACMIELNNRYALDGRDPSSYSGIMWTLGRFDRPWGPERSIFGTVRFMTSQSALRKLRMREYLKRYASDHPQASLPGFDTSPSPKRT
jgi:deoxyribodipyrimidine photo-lyase